MGANQNPWAGDRRFQKPNEGEAYQSEYDFPSDELFDAVQRNVQAIKVVSGINLNSGGSLVIPFPGRGFVMYDYASGNASRTPSGTALVLVQINDMNGDYFPARHNRGYTGSFQALVLTWAFQAGLACDFVLFRSTRQPWMSDGAGPVA
jgi:hypothetical protein